jgi:hypothetical protein
MRGRWVGGTGAEGGRDSGGGGRERWFYFCGALYQGPGSVQGLPHWGRYAGFAPSPPYHCQSTSGALPENEERGWLLTERGIIWETHLRPF